MDDPQTLNPMHMNMALLMNLKNVILWKKGIQKKVALKEARFKKEAPFKKGLTPKHRALFLPVDGW